MKALFVDTAGWIACADAADPDHEDACGARDNWLEHQGLLITSDYVIDETLTLLRLRLGLSAAEQWWHTLAASKRVVRELIHEERGEPGEPLRAVGRGEYHEDVRERSVRDERLRAVQHVPTTDFHS